MRRRAATEKTMKGLRVALSVVLAAALIMPTVLLSNLGNMLPEPKSALDGVDASSLIAEPSLQPEQASVPKTEEEKQAILDSYLADGTITEKDLGNQFIVDSLTGAFLEGEQSDAIEKCGNELDGYEDALSEAEERQADAERLAAEALDQAKTLTEAEVEAALNAAREAEESAFACDPTLSSEDVIVRQPEAQEPATRASKADEHAGAFMAARTQAFSTEEDLQTQSDSYSTSVVLKDVKSVILYDNSGTPQTQDVFVSYINNYLDRHTAFVQMLNMPSFYSPVLSADLRDGCIYVTLQLPAGAGEEPKTFEALYTKGADWEGYVKTISGQPVANDSTMMANIASTPGYDPSRDQAYRNAYKLAPYASYEDIVRSGNAIPESSSLYSKTIQELWPVHATQGMKVSMLEGEEEDIVRNVVYYSDGTSETTDLQFLGANSLTASYTMGEAGILYQPDFWMLGEGAKHGIDRMAAFIRSKTYNNYFAPFKSDVKMHRTVRDYFDRNIHDKAEEVAANLLSNIPIWSPMYSDSKLWNYYMSQAENAKPTDNWQSHAVELKMFNLLFLYTYWDRFLNFGIGGSEETGFQNNANAFLIVAFRGGVVKPGLSLVNMTYDVRSDTMLSYSMIRLMSNTVINTRLGPFTGIYNSPALIKTIVMRASDYADVANWFADYMSTIAFYHEYEPPAIEGHPETEELFWRGWDQASRRYPDYLPIWLTMDPGAMYMGSTSMLFACGSTYIYTSPADFEFNDAYRASFKTRLDSIFSYASKYASTIATIVGKDRVNTTIVLTLDNMTSRYDYGTAQNVYYESHGLWGKHYTEDPWHKHFYDVSELYDTTGGQGAAAATYNMSPTNKRILFLAYTSLSCGWSYYWSHEMAHALDNDVFLGAGRRDGGSNEDFTDGLLTQGHGSMTPVINLCYDYDISSDIMSNYDRDRIYGKDATDDFYGKVYETLDVLDYAALQAFLRLSKDEQNAVASQVWFSGQNGTSPLDSGTNTTILCSRSKVIGEYDGTTATMPVNASVFNDGSRKFQTVEEVYDNQLFLRPGIPDGGSITWSRQSYVTEDNRGSWWFPVHANTFYPDSRSFKVMMYRMLGREGYDAFATYGSAGGNDLQKLMKITGCSSYKEWQMRTWDGIEAKKGNLAYVDFDDLVDKFEAALESDAEAHDRNLGSMSSLRTRMFYMMKRVTNDFRYGIYENQRPVTHIRTLDDLLAIADDPRGNYVLDSDIDVTSIGLDAKESLVKGVFYGKFDGGGHSIYSQDAPLPYLFEGIRHAYVKDLSLGGSATGAVSPTIVNSELENITYVKFERSIRSVDDFVRISDDLKLGVRTFHLEADLNFAEWSRTNAASESKQTSVVAQPVIGTTETPVVLNGNGHKISGLDGASLFDRVCFAQVGNLSIENSKNHQNLESASFVSLLASRSYQSKFTDLFFNSVSLRGRSQVGFVSGDDGFANASGKDTRDGGSQFSRIQVTNAVLQTGSSTATSVCYGGFVSGRLCQSTLEDVYVQGTLGTYGVSCGGVAGAITKSAKLNRCISNVGINCPNSTKNGVIVGDIEKGAFDADSTKIANCFGLGNPALSEKTTPEQTQAAAGARIATFSAPEAVSVFENCFENAAQRYGSSLAVNEAADVAFARVDLKTPAQYTFPNSFAQPYSIANLRNNESLFASFGFSNDVWEFDPTIHVGYPMLRFVGNRNTFYDYDLDFKVDYQNEKLLFWGSSFNGNVVSMHNLPFRTTKDIPQMSLKAGDWMDVEFKDNPIAFSYISTEADSIDLSEIIEYEKFTNEETDYKGTRSVSLYYDMRASKKPYSFEKTLEIAPRPEMDCTDRLKGVRANSKGLGAIHYSSFGAYGSPELEYRLASGASDESTGDWAPITAAMTSVAPGSYEVRIVATDRSFASYPATVTVEEFDPNAVIFPLVLELGGGSWAEGYAAPEEYNSEEALVLPTSSQIERNGFTFAGWYASPTFSGSPVTSIPAGRTEPQTLYAKWNPNTYQVKMNLNGGTLQRPSDNVSSYVAGTEVTLPVPSHPYRTFAGWYENEACEGEPTTAISPLDYGDKEYWAKWDAVTYNVTLHLQEGELAEGLSGTFAYETGIGASLPGATEITRLGHTFKGWYDNEECTGQPIARISKSDTGNKELWAKWTADVYDVTLAFNGGKLLVGEQDVTSYQYGIGAELPGMERNGYRFDGWYDNQECTGSTVESIPAGSIGAKSFWAKWTPLSYEISYDLGRDETGAQPPSIDLSSFESYTTGSNLALPDAATMVWDDHVFAGWYSDASFSGSPLTRIDSETYGNLTLYARWVGNACVISFDVDGGLIDPAPDTVYSFANGAHKPGDEVALPQAPQVSRFCYTFEGWYDNASFNGSPVTSITLATGAVNLHAKWTLDSYRISYELDGGSFTSSANPPTSYTVQSGSIALPSAIDLTRNGFAFKGWYDNAGCSGLPISLLDTMGEGIKLEDKTFYAKWEPIKEDPDEPIDPDEPDDPSAISIISIALSDGLAQAVKWDASGYGYLEVPRSKMPAKAEDFAINVPDGIYVHSIVKREGTLLSMVRSFFQVVFQAQAQSDIWDIVLKHRTNPDVEKHFVLELMPIEEETPEPPKPDDPKPTNPTTPGGRDPSTPSSQTPSSQQQPSNISNGGGSQTGDANANGSGSASGSGAGTIAQTGDSTLALALVLGMAATSALLIGCFAHQRLSKNDAKRK